MRRHAPAAERNQTVLVPLWREVLPDTGTILEVASGSGQHAAKFAPYLGERRWLPSDCDTDALASIAAWCEGASSAVLPAQCLDVGVAGWQIPLADCSPAISAIVAINLIHIAPWAVTEGLIDGAGKLLGPDGLLFLYGPYLRAGEPTAPSNVDFDRWLRDRDPQWGVRDLDAVTALADAADLQLERVIPMPANNLSVLYRRRS